MLELDTVREIAGRYRPLRLIGQGGMGAVYEVEHLHTGQRLAMKILTGHQHWVSVERFRREARAASRIQSDHVVRITDADVAPELEGAPFLVMELLQGSDLERLCGTEPAAAGDVVEWLRQVARALDKAHQCGVVHRDLKPDNLFLTRREDGTPLVKILDFGIAKMAVDAAGSLTESGQWMGTPFYMAPEQVDDPNRAISGKVDIYAIGHIAFRLLVGKTYRTPGNLPQILVQIIKEAAEPPSRRGATLGPTFDAWFLRSCDRDPAKRFESATEQVEALATALATRGRAPARAEPRTPSPLEAAPTVAAAAATRNAVQRLPCAPGKSGFNIKGIAYRGLARLIQTSLPGGLDALGRELDDERIVDFLRQPFLASTWHDILPMMPINAAIARILGKSLATHAREQGMAQALFDAGRLYRRMFDAMTLDKLSKLIPTFERQYYDFGDASADLVEPRHLLLRRMDLPEFVLPWFAPMHAAYAEQTLRATGATFVTATCRPPTAAGARNGLRIVHADTDIRWLGEESR